MDIDNEYIFNNKIYEVATRNLKATFFDILSAENNIIDDQQRHEFKEKISNLQNNMKNIIEYIEQIDKISSPQQEIKYETNSNNQNSDNNDDLKEKTDITEKQIIPQNISIEEKLLDLQKHPNVLAEDIKTNNENNVQEETKEEAINEEVQMEKDDKTTNNDTKENVEENSNNFNFFKDTNDQTKAILVSDNQLNKLLNSQDDQIKKLTNKQEEINPENKEVETENIPVNMADMAIKLYKEGKTKEAQEIMDKITSHNE